MKKKISKLRLSTFKYLLFLPILLLAFCDGNLEEPTLNQENRLSKDAKVLLLMKAAIQSDSDQNLTQNKGVLSKSAVTEEDDQCTNFLYPMTFEVFSGDDPNADLREINSDEELMAFIDELTLEDGIVAFSPNYELYIFFPITLLDTDGVKTELNNLTELEGTLQMAVEACAGFKDESSDGDDDGNDDNRNDDDGDDDDDDSNDDGSNDGNDGNDEDDDDGNDDEEDDDGGDNGYNGDDGDDGDDDDEGNNDSEDDARIHHDSNSDYNDCDKKEKKVSICHKGKTICVSVNAIWGHMQNHKEDYLGSCDD